MSRIGCRYSEPARVQLGSYTHRTRTRRQYIRADLLGRHRQIALGVDAELEVERVLRIIAEEDGLLEPRPQSLRLHARLARRCRQVRLQVLEHVRDERELERARSRGHGHGLVRRDGPGAEEAVARRAFERDDLLHRLADGERGEHDRVGEDNERRLATGQDRQRGSRQWTQVGGLQRKPEANDADEPK